MKKTILAVAMLFAVNLTAQTYSNEVLTLKTLNGANVSKTVKLKLNQSTVNRVKELGFNGSENVIKYLNDEFQFSTLMVQAQLSNFVSFDFISGSVGSITVTESGKLVISYYFTAQNGFGNKLSAKAERRLFFRNGEIIDETVIIN